MNSSDQPDQFFRAGGSAGASSFSRRWSKWASGLFKRDKPLGSEPWFNPEAVTEQKREWLEQQKSHEAKTEATWPEHIYESFYVLGLSPDMEVTQVAEQLCELERKQRHHHDSDTDSEHGKEHVKAPQPSFAPQVLFRYPAGCSAPISDDEVAALAFPAGVAPEKLRRTPSLSALDEIVMGRDSDAQQQCFVFMIKVAGNFPLYGCCWYVREMLHRPPYLARSRYRTCKAPFRQCMIAAPRCYCLLSRYPFFELHFRVLKIVLDLERLERLLEYDSEKSQLPPTSLGVSMVTLSARTGRRSSTAVDPPVLAPPVAGGSSSRQPSGQQQQQVPMVHNRQAYCSECARIIEDMCPFTPGPDCPWQQQTQLQRKSSRSSGVLEQQTQSSLHQQQQQQRAPHLPMHTAASPAHCEVCGKPLGGLSPEPSGSEQGESAAAPAGPAGCVADAIAGAVANSILLNGPASQSGTDSAAAAAAAAAGPLEAGVLDQNHHQQQPQQQQSGASGIPVSKAWSAAAAAGTGSTSAYGEEKAWLSVQFDAIAAAVSEFDSAAGAHQPANSSSAAVGTERWANWQNVVEALKGVAAGPLLDSREDPQGVPEEPADGTDNDSEAAETSMVQRMWEAWAPKSGEQSSRTSGGLTGFLRSARSSKSCIAAMQLGPQRSGQQQQQQQAGVGEGSNHTDGAQQQGQQAEQQQITDMHSSSSYADAVQQQHSGAAADAEVNQQQKQDACEADSKHSAAAAAQASRIPPSHARGSDELAEQGTTAAAAAQAAGVSGTATASGSGNSCSGSEGHHSEHSSAERLPSGSCCNTSQSSFQSAEDDSNAAAAFSAEDASEMVAGGESSPAQQQQPDSTESNPVASTRLQLPDSRAQPRTEAGQFLEHQLQQQQQIPDSPSAVSPFSQLHSGAAVGVDPANLRLDSLAKQQPGSRVPAVKCFDDDSIITVSSYPSGPKLERQIPTKRASSAGTVSSMAAAAAAVAAAHGRVLPIRRSLSLYAKEQPLIRSSSCGVADGLAWTAVACPAAPDAGAGELQFIGAASDHASSFRDVTIAGNIPAGVGASEAVPVQLNSLPRVSVLPVARRSNRDVLEEVALQRTGELTENVCKTISHLVQADSTSLLSAYRNSPVPLPGEMYRLALGDLYRLEFERTLPLQHYAPPGRSKLQNDVHSFAEVEGAQQLQLWTVAALCRSLSLENIITLLNAALLEKQLVVFCPHIGTLAAIVLALVPLLRPFAWHSLMLPVTPSSMLAFLDAPVPFVLGVQYKTASVANRCHGLLRVNVYKDAIKNAYFPSLPNARQLLQALAPHHTALREAAPLAVERPVHVITPDEELAAHEFLAITHEYLSKMCGDLRLHTIVNVGMSKRTGVFMKESLIESLPAKDRTFMRAFTETMMFAAYADGVISDYCEA